MDAVSEFEGAEFGCTGPTFEPEWLRPADPAEAQLTQAISHNIDLVVELLKAKDEAMNTRRWAAAWKKAAKFYHHQADVFNALWEERRNEAIALRHQLDMSHEVADDLAALVAILVEVLRAIQPQVGNGVKAAIDGALKQAAIPDDEADETQLYGGA